MEKIEIILGLAKEIYSLYNQAQWNKKQCGRIVERIKYLILPVEDLSRQTQISKSVDEVLEGLSQTLENAKALVAKYTSYSWLKKLFFAIYMTEHFKLINERLNDAAQGLSLSMQVEKREMILRKFEDLNQRAQNRKDAEADLEELKNYFEKGPDRVSDQEDRVHQDVKYNKQQLAEMLNLLQKQLLPAPDTTEIKKEALTIYERLMETSSSILYRGEYHKSVVAIKRFKNEDIVDVSKACKTFWREVKTMKKFEHPNILHMYGICIDNTSGLTSFSIVMEYCERGTIREVLKKEQDLTWETRIRMSQGAALGLYRLHQTTEKSVVHGNINSVKFLVDLRYCVKLAGFEISRTESSIKRMDNADKQKEIHDSAYLSPQALGNINFIQDKPSEMYSFGIVLWEIAARSTPFKGLTTKQIFQKVAKEGYKEPLPEDCPEDLQRLIKQCQDYAPEARPSAGVVADKLMAILNKEMEKQA